MVAATGHNGSFLISEPATCTEDGYEDYYCQTCGEVYTIVLPAPGHTWTEGGLVPYCTVCNYGRTGDPAFWSLRNTDLVSSVEETYSYVYNGSKLTQMTKDGTSLLFVYDASGTPSELRYNGYYYHYVTNLQGDVIAILDEYGAVVVEYTYDAWGNILTVTGSLASTLGKLNPLTYRGYVYDWETGLYYLQSRYYNPEWGRFINADGYTSTGQGILGNNMFAYCGNNPVNYTDPTGQFLESILGFISEAATEAGNALREMKSAFAALGTLSVSDGFLLYGDVIAAVGAIGIVGGAAGYGLYQAVKSSSATRAKTKAIAKAETVSVSDDTKYYYWTATLVNNVVVPGTPLTYTEAQLWVAQEKDLLCKNRAAAIAIVKFYPGAEWDPPHGGKFGLERGYLPHYHLNGGHTCHIWYLGE